MITENRLRQFLVCSKREDVRGEGRLKPLAEQNKLVLQSPAEPVEGSGGQGSGEKGAESESPTKEERQDPGNNGFVVTGKVSSNIASPSHKAFHHHCSFAVNAQLIECILKLGQQSSHIFDKWQQSI